MNRSHLITINESTRVGTARRRAILLAEKIGLDATTVGKVGIVATEAGGNLLKHAGGGSLLVRAVGGTSPTGIEILAVDKGPGMPDVRKCLKDGYSTAGSPGTGLGAISRLSTVFDIYSAPGQGTCILSQVWAGPVKSPGPLCIGAVCTPKIEDDACGDAWNWRFSAQTCQIFVVDGLGHGPLAAQAADEAIRVFNGSTFGGPARTIETMHGPLRSTRGASLALAELKVAERQVVYSGVGNIAGVILTDGKTRSMISHNGTVGHELHRVSDFTYPWSPGSTLVMHSDGLVSRWTLDPYPGLITHHPSLIAAVMMRDFQRGRDDVVVVVARENNSST